ncbi:MAG: hypothetical protein IMZ64_08995 [Bacteroidetes bacterium]|nr:hypothetical protein [Bacteroidota bacterium]
MYAIKIVSNEHVYLHLADEVNYIYKTAKGSEDFYSEMENGENVFIVGEIADGEFEYLEVYLHTDHSVKLFYIMPTAWLYIMQEGKTIEAINVHEIKQSVEV